MAVVDEEVAVVHTDDEVKKEKKDKKRKRETAEEDDEPVDEAERLNIAERKRLKKERKRMEKEQILECTHYYCDLVTIHNFLFAFTPSVHHKELATQFDQFELWFPSIQFILLNQVEKLN